MSSVPARCAGWLATMPTDRPAEAHEADQDVGRVVLVHLEEVAVVGHALHQRVHVVGLVGRFRDQRVERVVLAIDGIAGVEARRRIEVVRRQERQQLAHQRDRLAIAGHGEVRDAALHAVRVRAAELLLGDVLVGDGADDVRPGHEHVARALDHHGEVGDGRRVDRAAGARPHHRGDLRHDARRQRVAEEDVGVAGERDHAFLDARAAGVVEPDDRRPELHRQIHDLADLGGVGLRQRSAEDGEVLGEGVDDAAVDAAGAGDDAVARHDLVGHAEVEAAMRDELVDLLEGAGVEELGDALAGGELAGGVLPLDAGRAAAGFGPSFQIREGVPTGHEERTTP